MSKIVAFRNAVMAGLKENVPELRTVDWYDGVFNQDDLAEWTVKTPSAFVAVINGPAPSHSTGEMNSELRCVVALIANDKRKPRDADEKAWTLCEKIADWAHQNTFGDPNAGVACGIKFRRLSHPELRHEGIAIGIIEWNTTLTIGTNKVIKRETYQHEGAPIPDLPHDLAARAMAKVGKISASEFLGLPADGDAYVGARTTDHGVAEMQMVPDQVYEPPK